MKKLTFRTRFVRSRAGQNADSPAVPLHSGGPTYGRCPSYRLAATFLRFRRLLHLQMAGVVALCVWVLCLHAESTRATEVVFQQQEVLGYNWARHLLTYDVEFKSAEARTDALSLRDAEGTAVPFQMSDVQQRPDRSIRKAKVSFYAALPADGELRHVLGGAAGKDARPSLGVKPVTANAAGNGAVTLSNSYTAVRLPAVRSNLAKPVPLARAPGPIQAFRLANGNWIGGSKFLAEEAPDTKLPYAWRPRSR